MGEEEEEEEEEAEAEKEKEKEKEKEAEKEEEKPANRLQVSNLRPPHVCPASTEIETHVPLITTSANSTSLRSPEPITFHKPP